MKFRTSCQLSTPGGLLERILPEQSMTSATSSLQSVQHKFSKLISQRVYSGSLPCCLSGTYISERKTIVYIIPVTFPLVAPTHVGVVADGVLVVVAGGDVVVDDAVVGAKQPANHLRDRMLKLSLLALPYLTHSMLHSPEHNMSTSVFYHPPT